MSDQTRERPLWSRNALLNELEIERANNLLAELPADHPLAVFVRLQLHAAVALREQGEIIVSNWHLGMIARKLRWPGWV